MSQTAGEFRPENLPSAVSQFRSDRQIPNVSETHFDGGQCRIYKVNFDDGESWAIRIPIHMKGSQEQITTCFRIEQQILEEINKKGFAWAPKLHGWNDTFENEIGYPFTALSWIPGSSLAWTTTSPSRHFRNKVLAQVAEIQTSLINQTIEDRMFSYRIKALCSPKYRWACNRPFYEDYQQQDCTSSGRQTARNN